MRSLFLFVVLAGCACAQAMPLGVRTAMWGIGPVQHGGGDPWEGEVLEVECIVGEKVVFDIGLVGYTAKNLPGGLAYAAKTGKVSGAAKKAGEYEAVFLQAGRQDVSVLFSVREEVVSIGCIGLSGGSFTAGVAGSVSGIPLEISCETGVKSVSVAKLPAGMKYDAKSGRIIGSPTKAGNYTVSVTVTTKTGAKRTEDISISVDALPDGAVGIFNGFVKAPDGVENIGTFRMTATDVGKLTAKIVTAAGTYSFSGACWDSAEAGIYTAVLTTKKNDTLELSLDSTAGWNAYQLTGMFASASMPSNQGVDVVASRNAFGKTWHFAAEGGNDSGWTLSYAPSAKGAALTVTLNADGSTKIAGKLGALTVNASGYSDVTGLSNGVIYADFVSVASIKEGKTTAKRAVSIRANLWFDRSNDHDEGVGTATIVDW